MQATAQTDANKQTNYTRDICQKQDMSARMHQDCKIAEAVTACNAVQVEAGAAKDELKRLRKEMLRLKNEWTTLRALYESAKVRYLHVKQTSAFAASEADQILMRPAA